MPNLNLKIGNFNPATKVRHPLGFLGTVVPAKLEASKLIESRIKRSCALIHSSKLNNELRINSILQELLRSQVIDETEIYKARPVVTDWINLIFVKRNVQEWERWIKKNIPGFLLEKEPSPARKTFCFLLDNHFIPHEKFRFKSELEINLNCYQRYQADPRKGLSEVEKGELVRQIEFLRFLQLDNNYILSKLYEAIQTGIEVDTKDYKLVYDEKQKILMEMDDIRWRIIKILRWTPTNDQKAIILMKAFLGSPNLTDRMYAMGYLGRAAGRLFKFHPGQSMRIIRYILDRKSEIVRDNPPILILEMVKAVMGDLDARQIYQRKYLFESDLCVQGLASIAQDETIESEIRREAILGLSIFARIGRNSKAKEILSSLRRSKSILCREEALLALGKPLPSMLPRIIISPHDLKQEHTKTQEQLLFYRGRLHHYTRLADWEPIGLTLGRGLNLYEVAIHDKKWLGIRKFAPVAPKFPHRRLIPAIERIVSSLGWILGLPRVSKVQLIEDEEARDSYFTYAVGQHFPLSSSMHDQVSGMKQAEKLLAKHTTVERGLSEIMRNLLLETYGERDMDTEEIERDPLIKEVLQSNRIGSTIAFLGRQKEVQAELWFRKCQNIFSNPEFLDQIKFFNWIIGNTDQYGYRNILATEKRKTEKVQLYLIDFTACFGFLQRADLDWRYHWRRFTSNLHMCAKDAPEIFIKNIKPVVINFYTLPDNVINEILEEIHFGELTREEKDALRLLLLAEKEALAKQFIKWRI